MRAHGKDQASIGPRHDADRRFLCQKSSEGQEPSGRDRASLLQTDNHNGQEVQEDPSAKSRDEVSTEPQDVATPVDARLI